MISGISQNDPTANSSATNSATQRAQQDCPLKPWRALRGGSVEKTR